MPSVPQSLALATLLAAASPASAEPAFEPRAICRTAIAAITDRDPKLVQTAVAADGVVLLTYVRRIDNFVWAYRCRLQDNRIIWANDPGRWREVFNSDYFEGFPNPGVVGNGGFIDASGPPTAEMPYSATIVVPANGVLVFVPE